MEKNGKKQRICITIDRSLYLKLISKDAFNISSFCNEVLHMKLNNHGSNNPDKIALETKIKEIGAKTKALEEEMFKAKIELQEIEDKEEKQRKEDEEKSLQLVKGLKANNPLRDLQW